VTKGRQLLIGTSASECNANAVIALCLLCCSQAKQKSIALLTNKMKKSNQPCTFYRRFGKCVRKEKGTCPHVHDPKQVAVCKK
jgi:hypothetical protein